MKTLLTSLTVILLVLVVTGCEKKPAEQASEQNAAALSEAAGQGLETFTSAAAAQVKAHESQLSALQSGAKSLADDKLSDLISQLETKLSAAKAKLSEIKSAEGGTTAGLQSELTQLLGDTDGLYAKAKSMLDELMAAAAEKAPEVEKATESVKLPGM